MVDITFIRENADAVQKAAEEKGINLDISSLLSVDEKRRTLQQQVDKFREERNTVSDDIAKEQDKAKRQELISYMQAKKDEQKRLEEMYAEVEKEFNALMLQVPTVHAEDTPIGEGESANTEIYKSQEPPTFDFEPKSHIELGESLDIIDFEKGAEVAGYRGYYLKNEAVMLQMGFLMFALQKAISKGFMPMIPPTLVRAFALKGSGYFYSNDDKAEIYKIANEDKDADGTTKKEDKYLVGTAEPSILAYYANRVLDEKDLPLRVCGFSQCYRSEIGSYGKDTKGIFRVHEFMKVELVGITTNSIEESDKLHQEMLELSKELHEDLGLPYHVLRIGSGDMSAGKYKMFDLEAWIPSRDGWGETGSASNFVDWQARRLNARYKTKDGETKFVHMLNDTALPSPRILISILENYQHADGSVKVPEVLVPFTGFTEIKPKK